MIPVPCNRPSKEFSRGIHSRFTLASPAPAILARMKTPGMKSSTAVFLQMIIVGVGLGTLALMLLEPHLEGRNAHATTFEIYFKDPFLAYAYVGSLPFFMALYRAYGLFGHVRRTEAFSPATLEALRAIRRCALALIGFVAGAVIFILVCGDGDDRPGGIFMSALVALAAAVIAATTAVLGRNLQSALERSTRGRS